MEKQGQREPLFSFMEVSWMAPAGGVSRPAEGGRIQRRGRADPDDFACR